ncbi:MAG: cation transporter [Bacteroidales bacterium]
MKKIVILIFTSLLIAACNSGNKAETEEAKQEINVENLVEVTISVNGMTCEGCENSVKNSIGTLAGIEEVTASHTDSTATVSYDKTAVSLEEIEGKIADAGYVVVR